MTTGYSATGEASVRLMGLIQLKASLKLQKNTGMQPNRRTNPRKIAKQLLNMKTNNFEKLLMGLEDYIQDYMFEHPEAKIERF